MEIIQQLLPEGQKRVKGREYRIAVSIAIIVVLTFISFSSVLDNGFIWDDDKYVTQNHLIRDLSWSNVKVIFSSFYKGFFSQPLVLLSFSLEYHFFKLAPFIYHLDNLILHIFNSLLVFYVIFMLSDRVSISLVTALLFGVHTLHVESVAWVTERKDMLSTLFFLSSLLSYLLYRKGELKRYYYLSIFVFILSLFSKPMVVTLPLVLFLCDYLSGRGFNRTAILEKLPYFILSGIFGIITITIHWTDDALTSRSFAPFAERFLIAGRSLIFYLTKAVVPLKLSAIYPYPDEVGILLPVYFISILLLMVLVVMALYSRRWTRGIIFGSLFFIITILPVIRLIPFPGGGAAMADRYMYIPSIGLFYMVGLAFHRVYNWGGTFERTIRISLILFLSVVVLIFSILTYQRNNVWQDNETLWSDVLKNYPESFLAHYNLANIYDKKGLLDKAIGEYREAVRLYPYYLDARNNLGAAYHKKGMWDKAIEEYQKVLKLDPHYSDAFYNLAAALEMAGDKERAILNYKRFVNTTDQTGPFIDDLKKRIRHLEGE